MPYIIILFTGTTIIYFKYRSISIFQWYQAWHTLIKYIHLFLAYKKTNKMWSNRQAIVSNRIYPLAKQCQYWPWAELAFKNAYCWLAHFNNHVEEMECLFLRARGAVIVNWTYLFWSSVTAVHPSSSISTWGDPSQITGSATIK